jgi:hypothetical protein
MLRGENPIFVALFPLAGKVPGFLGAAVSTQPQHTSRPADGLACRRQG